MCFCVMTEHKTDSFLERRRSCIMWRLMLLYKSPFMNLAFHVCTDLLFAFSAGVMSVSARCVRKCVCQVILFFLFLFYHVGTNGAWCSDTLFSGCGGCNCPPTFPRSLAVRCSFVMSKVSATFGSDTAAPLKKKTNNQKNPASCLFIGKLIFIHKNCFILLL